MLYWIMIKNILKHLTFWVLLAVIVGILLGVFAPVFAVSLNIFANIFIGIIKIFIIPIVFLTIVLGISGMSDLKKVGRIGFKALLYFEVVTTFAFIVGFAVVELTQPGSMNKTQLSIQPAATVAVKTHIDWIAFLMSNTLLQVVILAIIVGVGLHFSRYREQTVFQLQKTSRIVFKGLHLVMYTAPLAALSGMAYTVGKFGLHTLLPLAKLMLSVYLTMAIFVFVILGAILRYYHLNIFTFLKTISEELLLVLGTSSSEVALPSLMRKLEAMGCSQSVVGLVVPAGYSFNLDGTSIYLSMAVMFLAQLYGVHLTTLDVLGIIVILMITSKGAAAVTGGGFIVLASTLTVIHQIPLEGLAFLLGVDRFMSEARAITNIIGNGVATLVISKSEKDF